MRGRSDQLAFGRGMRAAALALIGSSALFTGLVVGVPAIDFAYRSRPAHVAIESGACVIALIAALLLAARYLERARLRDLLLTAALALLGGSTLGFYVVPSVVPDVPGPFTTWAPLSGSLAGAALLAAAAWVPDRRLRRPRRALAAAGAAVALGLLLIAGVLQAVEDRLPRGIDPLLRPETSGGPAVEGHPALQAVNLAGALLMAAAMAGLLRNALRSGDRLLAWLGVAAGIAVFSRANYALFPSRYSEWVYTGDILRGVFYLVIAVAAAHEIFATQRARALAEVLEERRRVARELHDGLAQDLAYIAGRARSLARGHGAPAQELPIIAQAADRALAESRDAIAALTHPGPGSLADHLADVASVVAGRAGSRTVLHRNGDLTARPDARHEIGRVVREAVTNAVVHGGARTVTVRLDGGDPVRVAVSDDGVGFDPDDPGRRQGVGLASMRERAAGMGGALALSSRPGEGTRVELSVPRAAVEAERGGPPRDS